MVSQMPIGKVRDSGASKYEHVSDLAGLFFEGEEFFDGGVEVACACLDRAVRPTLMSRKLE
jgi:hypothetical protein